MPFANTQHDVLQSIALNFAIADRLTVTDKYLEVRGNRHSYKIHLGSGNTMIMPHNRYLCIVRGTPDRKAKSIRLPFAGDTML